MRLRIRTLLLTAALLCSMTSTVSACIYIPILEPFYWLFGCSGCHGGYGYVNSGPNPYGVSRCIDDWLGYGYLRNQEGTLGHYPGRPVSCYHPVFPHLLNPCSWFAPCPLFAPYGPPCGVMTPMVAPLAPPMAVPYQMPYQAQWQNQGPGRMPGLMNPYGGNCSDPCGSQCMPQPMMQYQPAQRPVTTWRPMTVDRGRWHWQRVWVPRPRTVMVPQTQYVMQAPAMQMPMMQNPMMDSGCGDGCGGDMGSMMPGSEYMQSPEMMPGAQIMQGAAYPEMNSGSGCCGSDSGLPQSGYESGTPAVPQSTMMMSPGSMPMSRMSMGQPSNIAPYSSMSRWYSNPGYANPGYSTARSNLSYRQPMAAQPAYGTNMYRQPQSGNFTGNSAMRPMFPNSFNGRPPIQQASWSQPAPTATARRYPNSVQ